VNIARCGVSQLSVSSPSLKLFKGLISGSDEEGEVFLSGAETKLLVWIGAWHCVTTDGRSSASTADFAFKEDERMRRAWKANMTGKHKEDEEHDSKPSTKAEHGSPTLRHTLIITAGIPWSSNAPDSVQP
jgi:hypothetical protein